MQVIDEYRDYSAKIWTNDAAATPANGVLTAEELLDNAGLNWDAEFRPMFVKQANGDFTEDKSRAIVRPARAGEPEAAQGHDVTLGVAKGRFQILQNRTAVETLMQPLVDAGMMAYTAAGALKRGRKAWVMATLAVGKVRDAKDGQPDFVGRNLMLLNGHDGRTGVIFNTNEVRSTCTNVILSAITSGFTVRMRHDGRLHLNMATAYEELGKLSTDFNDSLEQYRFMAQVQLTQKDVDALFAMTFPELKKDEEEQGARVKKMTGEMERLMVEGRGNGGGSVWDWFNGVTEYLDHEGTAKKREANFVSSLMGQRAKVRERAMAAAMKMAKRKR